MSHHGIGNTFDGRYRLISPLGEGGMGVAYRAWDKKLGVPVVVKTPQPSLSRRRIAQERFRREIKIMVAVPHPDIVPVTGFGDDAEVGPYVILRFLPGGSLRDRYTKTADKQRKPMAAPTLRSWLPYVAAALDHLHSNNVVHRDVKPTNIFFDAHSKGYLGDFGIAKVLAESDELSVDAGLTGDLPPGTLPYMPPEAFTTQGYDPSKGDQYALAICVYEWLTGRLPFDGDAAALLLQITQGAIVPLSRHRSSLPLGVSLAVGHALQTNPSDRFETCSRFADAVLREVGPWERKSGEYLLLCPQCENLIRIFHALGGRTCRCSQCNARLLVSSELDALWLPDEENAGSSKGASASAGRDSNYGKSRKTQTEYDTPVDPSEDSVQERRTGSMGIARNGARIGLLLIAVCVATIGYFLLR